MTQENLPLEFDPYPGCWCVVVPQFSGPWAVTWYPYDQKHFAEQHLEHELNNFLGSERFRPRLELDPTVTPADFESEEEEEDRWADYY